MVHIAKPQNGEGTHIWERNEATKKSKQNERQRRCRQRQKTAIHSVMAIASEPIFEDTRYVTLGMDVDQDMSTFRSTSRCAKRLAMEWFHQTATSSVKY
jgi:hypothetical protein